MTISRHHAVNRTSSKGGAFIGTCSQCGQVGLTLAQAMTTECPNQRGLTEGEAVLEAIEGPVMTAQPIDFTALAREIVGDYLVRCFDAQHLTPMDEALADVIAAKFASIATQARQEGIEEAARVANGYVGCDRIAESIRALAAADPAPGDQPVDHHMEAIGAGCYPLDDDSAPAHPVEQVERLREEIEHLNGVIARLSEQVDSMAAGPRANRRPLSAPRPAPKGPTE